MLICKQKLTWSLDFFTDFLHFKESYNLIGQQHFGQQLQKKNFARHGVCDGKNKKNFQFALFLEKTNDKFFQKNAKYPVFHKNTFKHVSFPKKLMTQLREKFLTDGQTKE